MNQDINIRSCTLAIGYRRAKDQDGITEDRVGKVAIRFQGDDNEAKDKSFYYQENLVKDWRDQDIGAFKAFFTGQVRRRDYKVIVFFTLAHVMALVISIVVSSNTKTSAGVALVLIPLLHFMWIPLSLLSNFITH